MTERTTLYTHHIIHVDIHGEERSLSDFLDNIQRDLKDLESARSDIDELEYAVRELEQSVRSLNYQVSQLELNT